MSHGAADCQVLTDAFADSCDHFSLVKSSKKTVTKRQDSADSVEQILVNCNMLDQVDSFDCYLGGNITSNPRLDKSAAGLERQPQLSTDSGTGLGPTGYLPNTRKLTYTRPVCSASYSMAVKRGHPTCTRRKGFMPPMCDACGTYSM